MSLSPYLSPLIVFLSVAAYGALHSLLASRAAKRLARRWLGAAADRFYRLFFNLVGAVTFLPPVALAALLPDRTLYTIPAPWLYLALAGQGLAVALLLVGLRQTGAWEFLGLSQLAGGEEAGDGKLVTRGLYRWVRHPLYTAGLLFIWLAPRMTLNLLALNAGITAYLYVGAWFEERKLLRQFGEAYRRYQARTPMILPRPWMAAGGD